MGDFIRRREMLQIFGGGEEGDEMIEKISTVTLSAEASYMATAIDFSKWAVLFVEASIVKPEADGSNATVVINLSNSASGEQGELSRITDLVPSSSSTASVTEYNSMISLPLDSSTGIIWTTRGTLNKSNSLNYGGDARTYNTSAAYLKIRTWSNNFGVGSTMSVWGIKKS